MNRITRNTIIAATLVCACFGSLPAYAEPEVRIRDITQLAGEHPNQLTGLGLVVGLAGTGGKSESTKRLMILLLQNLGVRSDPQLRALIRQAQEKTDNVSVVVVTADLPAHAKPGQQIDVLVSTLDDAESLAGGVLISTPLTGHDNEVYAVASGPISINGGNFGGEAASVVKNHPTTGRVAGGAVVEQEVPSTVFDQGFFRLLLRNPDWETARRVTDAINQFAPSAAQMHDPAMISVLVPSEHALQPHQFVAMCQEQTVIPDAPARVVINERTGTIVVGAKVKLSSVAIAHGNIIVSTVESASVSQPEPFSDGETVTVPQTDVDVTEQQSRLSVVDETVTVGDLAASLNALGVTPRDLSVIFQMLKENGALHAELQVK